MVTIGNHDSGREEECPIPKKPRLISSSPIQPQQKLTTNVTNSIGSFTSNEVSSLQQLIQGNVLYHVKVIMRMTCMNVLSLY